MPRLGRLRWEGRNLVGRARPVDFDVHPFAIHRPLAGNLHRAQIKPAEIKTDPIDIIARFVAAVAPGGALAATGLIGLRSDPLGDRAVGQPRSVAGLPGNREVLVNHDRVWTGEVGIGAGDQFVVRIHCDGRQQGPVVIHSSVEQAGNGCSLQRQND